MTKEVKPIIKKATSDIPKTDEADLTLAPTTLRSAH